MALEQLTYSQHGPSCCRLWKRGQEGKSLAKSKIGQPNPSRRSRPQSYRGKLRQSSEPGLCRVECQTEKGRGGKAMMRKTWKVLRALPGPTALPDGVEPPEILASTVMATSDCCTQDTRGPVPEHSSYQHDHLASKEARAVTTQPPGPTAGYRTFRKSTEPALGRKRLLLSA